jgi:collagenase-like PrtC family protease
MTITDSAGIAFAKSIGIERVVVGRELSVRDIQRIQKQMSKKEFQKYQTKEFDGSDASDHNGRHVEIEAFVHGALCVSYSGQCFSSEAWGGRSANRGQCAQACRMPYGLIVNGTLKELRDDVQCA